MNNTEEAKQFSKPYSKKPEDIVISTVKGNRVVCGLTEEESTVAYDKDRRMIASWLNWDDNKSTTNRTEAVYDSYGRRIAERVISGSHVGQFDGEVFIVTLFKYNEAGDQRYYKTFFRNPTDSQDNEYGWFKADGVKDGKPYWEEDQFTPLSS